MWGGNDAEASSSIQRIQPKPIVTGDRFNILVDRASTSVWYESQTPYNITSPNMEFDVVTLDGRIIPSFKNDQWPVGEPFQILTSTTRQNLEITVL